METFIDEDWQKVNRKDKTDGLSQKAVDAYRRENPGSKLKTAVTKDPKKLKKGSKSAKRRLSFCRRMKGMKSKLTSAETSRDPDSKINKALRRWNCSYEPTGTTIAEKAVSKKQQRFFGIVRAAQKGTLEGEASPQVQRAAADMKMKDVKKFASTKHKGLPMKKESYYNWRDELELEEGNPLQKGWNWFVPHPSKSANPNVRSGKLQPGKLEKPSLDWMNKKAAEINVPLKVAGKIVKAGKWIAKNPGKTAAIGAGVVGAGMLAKRALSGKKKKKEVKESAALKKVINTVRGKKPEEKKPQKAMDAGARGRRLLKRREYRAKISPFIPKELED